MALGVILYTLVLGLFAQDAVEFGRSLAQILNLTAMVLICLNARLERRDEIRRSIGVFCVVATAAGLFVIAQALTFNLWGDFQLANLLGPFAPLGPGDEVYEPSPLAALPRANGFYSEPSVAGWFMSFALALALAARRLYPVLTTLTAAICALAAMATLSLTGVLGPAIVLAGYVLFVRDRRGGQAVLAGARRQRRRARDLLRPSARDPGPLSQLRPARHLDLLPPDRALHADHRVPRARFPLGYPLGQTDFIASRHYYINWADGSQTNIDNTLFTIVFYFGLLGILFNATYLLQAGALSAAQAPRGRPDHAEPPDRARDHRRRLGASLRADDRLRDRRRPLPAGGAAGRAARCRDRRLVALIRPRSVALAGARNGGQQLGLALPGAGEVALLDVAVAADLLRNPGDLDREPVIVEGEAGQQLLDHLLVGADQPPLGAALGAVAERIEGRAAQPLEPRELTHRDQDPGPVGALLELAGRRVARGPERWRQVDLELRPALELVREPRAELAVGVEARDLVLVLVGEQLEVVARDRLGQLAAARRARGLDRARALDQRAVALGIGRVLVVGEERDPARDRLVQALRRALAVARAAAGRRRAPRPRPGRAPPGGPSGTRAGSSPRRPG